MAVQFPHTHSVPVEKYYGNLCTEQRIKRMTLELRMLKHLVTGQPREDETFRIHENSTPWYVTFASVAGIFLTLWYANLLRF